MFEINLVCPVCGAVQFTYNPETNAFECPDCLWTGTTDEMDAQVFEA